MTVIHPIEVSEVAQVYDGRTPAFPALKRVLSGYADVRQLHRHTRNSPSNSSLTFSVRLATGGVYDRHTPHLSGDATQCV